MNHVAIYLRIVGTYTPVALDVLRGGRGGPCERRMNSNTTTDCHGSLSTSMNWLILLVLAAMYAWHVMLGLSVYALAFQRLAICLTTSSARRDPKTVPWHWEMAGIIHGAL
jgi:hypothetical protein